MRRVNLLHAHGSPTGYLYYQHGCRCVACGAAMTEYDHKYNAEHTKERAEYRRKRAAEHPEEGRRRHLSYQYGMDAQAWEADFSSQGERCKCCGTDDPGGRAGWHTDHDHKTGTMRGILCLHCNMGLGHFRDDPERLMAAIEYLAAATL